MFQMIVSHIRNTGDAAWLNVPVVHVGDESPSLPTPDAYVTVADEGKPFLRVDVHDTNHSAFSETIVWQGWVVIGFGHQLHLVDLRSNNTRSINLGFYFGHLYPTEDRLLVASGDSLWCIIPDGSDAWSAGNLGLDGVIVDHVDSSTVYGQGEWDPPGGWKPFQVSLLTGARMNEAM